MLPKIMIVEDDEVIREIYALKFEMEGYQVAVANNGQEALDKIGQFQPHFILLDMMMPVLDGVGFMRQFVPEDNPETEIIIFSNVSAAGQVDTVRLLGAKEYWVKSDYTPEELVARIAERWERRNQDKPLQSSN